MYMNLLCRMFYFIPKNFFTRPMKVRRGLIWSLALSWKIRKETTEPNPPTLESHIDHQFKIPDQFHYKEHTEIKRAHHWARWISKAMRAFTIFVDGSEILFCLCTWLNCILRKIKKKMILVKATVYSTFKTLKNHKW